MKVDVSQESDSQSDEEEDSVDEDSIQEEEQDKEHLAAADHTDEYTDSETGKSYWKKVRLNSPFVFVMAIVILKASPLKQNPYIPQSTHPSLHKKLLLLQHFRTIAVLTLWINNYH